MKNKGLTKALPDYSTKSHRREPIRHGNPWFREMTATRRVGALRTGYVWVVLGCTGVVRRGVWTRLLLSVCQVFSHALYPGRTKRLSSASINLQTHLFVGARLAKKGCHRYRQTKDPALDRVYLFIAITDRCGVHGDRPRLLTVYMMLLTTPMIRSLGPPHLLSSCDSWMLARLCSSEIPTPLIIT